MLSILTTASTIICLVVWSVIIVAFVALKVKQLTNGKGLVLSNKTASNVDKSNSLEKPTNTDFSDTDKTDKNNLFLH